MVGPPHPQPAPGGPARSREGTVALVLDGAGRAGTERHVLGLVRGLRAAGAPVLLVTSHPGPLVDAAVALGAAWRPCPRPSSRRYLGDLTRLLRAERPAVVHTHSGRVGSLAGRCARVPIIVDTRHGIPERLRALYARLPALRRWEGIKSRLAHRTLCVCAADAEWMERAAGLPARLLRVVTNGIAAPAGPPGEEATTEESVEEAVGSLAADGRTGFAEDARSGRRAVGRTALGLPGKTPVVAFIGRLTPQKAPGRVLELLQRLREGDVPGGDPARSRNSPLGDGQITAPPCAVICGTGPLESELRAAEERMGLRGAVHWTGEVEDAGLVLAAADLLVLPSEWEGLPYVLLESMAAATPILATPVGGVPEVLTGALKAGCLPWSPESWSTAARRLLLDPAARAAWRAAAAERLPDFSEAATVRGICAVYRELGWSSGGPAGRL